MNAVQALGFETWMVLPPPLTTVLWPHGWPKQCFFTSERCRCIGNQKTNEAIQILFSCIDGMKHLNRDRRDSFLLAPVSSEVRSRWWFCQSIMHVSGLGWASNAYLQLENLRSSHELHQVGLLLCILMCLTPSCWFFNWNQTHACTNVFPETCHNLKLFKMKQGMPALMFSGRFSNKNVKSFLLWRFHVAVSFRQEESWCGNSFTRIFSSDKVSSIQATPAHYHQAE